MIYSDWKKNSKLLELTRKNFTKIDSLKYDKQVAREYNMKKSYLSQLDELNILEKKINQNSLLELSVARNFLRDLHFISDNDKRIEELSRRSYKKRFNGF